MVSDIIVVGALVVVVTTVGFEVTTVVSLLVVLERTDVVVSGLTMAEDVGPIGTVFGAVVVDAVCNVVASIVVVSKCLAVVSDICVVGKVVTLVATLGLEVTTVVDLLFVVAGTDVVVSAITVLEDVVGTVVTVFGAVVVDAVCDVLASFVVDSKGVPVVPSVVIVGTLVTKVGLEVTTGVSLLVVVAGTNVVVSAIIVLEGVV